ncbi:hypothetical protein V8E54_012314 [Elaphomyces granulatus]
MRRNNYRLLARPLWICYQCRAAHSAAANDLRTGQKRNKLIPKTPARTRFAPSPTGYLHLGSIRTALFSFLLAKRTGGQFVLRIEDTDKKRTIPDAERRLQDDLRWVGLQWDEGPDRGGPYGPYRQSQRTAIYQHYAHDLLTRGHSYRCFCTPERLDMLARHRSQIGLPAGYDRKCIDIRVDEAQERAAKGETYVVRLMVDDYPKFDDLVYGKTGQIASSITKNKLDLYDDPILLKSDGCPTYHLANVVDDYMMNITHVIRGTEWMSSTPMHVSLYNAFNWKPPRFGHVPLLVDENGQKLSKRNADIDISFFRDQQGILPSALVNFAALLGWSHSQKSDVLPLQDLQQIFNLKITKGNTVVSFEKLWFLQKAHAQRVVATGGAEFENMVTKVSEAVERQWPRNQLESILRGRTLFQYISLLLRADAKSYTNIEEFLSRNNTFFTASLNRPPYVATSSKKLSSSAETSSSSVAEIHVPLSILHTAAIALCLVPESHWTAETHRLNIASYNGAVDKSGAKEDLAADRVFERELYHFLRWALSAGAPGPGIPETMEILGRAESIRRLEEARGLTCEMTKSISGFAHSKRPKDPSRKSEN